MKGIAIGFSSSSRNLLERLLETEFTNQIYISSSNQDENKDLEISSSEVKEILKECWKEVDLIIFVGSLSASVRLFHPYLISKDKDPGIIVMDHKGSKLIPLIGLHQSNTEKIAHQISHLFDGEVITTNKSTTNKLFNIDQFGYSWGWKRSGSIKNWSRLVIAQSNQHPVFFHQTSGSNIWKSAELSKTVFEIGKTEVSHFPERTFHISSSNQYKNTWHPPTLWIGIGCERNTSKKLIRNAIDDCLISNELSELSIAGLATVDLKKNEKAILEIIKEKNWPIRYFSSIELSKIDVPNPSVNVFKEIGTPSVAEAACISAAGEESKLIIEKKIYKEDGSGAVTLSIAESPNQFAPGKGEVHIVGSGPGDLSYLTGDAKKALTKCSVWIGYKIYLDLLEPFRSSGQIRIDSELTQEKKRCEKAIQLAEQGIKVAIISSGDAGIYGMAGLVIELSQTIENEFRPLVEIHPGISSVQLAASIAGAPLMNDFCVISLSDKLTPWEKIENRIDGAIQGDFVVAIFNPRSQERNWQLQKTISMFLKARGSNTPVFIARQVGRAEQSIKLCKLSTINIDEIDMFTLLIIGNSYTKILGNKFVTQRGYL